MKIEIIWVRHKILERSQAIIAIKDAILQYLIENY